MKCSIFWSPNKNITLKDGMEHFPSHSSWKRSDSDKIHFAKSSRHLQSEEICHAQSCFHSLIFPGSKQMARPSNQNFLIWWHTTKIACFFDNCFSNMFRTRTVRADTTEISRSRHFLGICVVFALLLACSLNFHEENERSFELESDAVQNPSDTVSTRSLRHSRLHHSSGEAFRAWHKGPLNVDRVKLFDC